MRRRGKLIVYESLEEMEIHVGANQMYLGMMEAEENDDLRSIVLMDGWYLHFGEDFKTFHLWWDREQWKDIEIAFALGTEATISVMNQAIFGTGEQDANEVFEYVAEIVAALGKDFTEFLIEEI